MSEKTNRTKQVFCSPEVKVIVTEELIQNGVRSDSGHCMVNKAVGVAVPEAKHVAVDLQTIRFSLPETGLRYVYLTPRIVQIPLIKFDQGERPEPFTFTLRDAHVVAMRPRRKTNHKGASTEQLKRARSVKAGLVDNGNGKVGVIGGQAPPKMDIRLGNRRTFGLRALGSPSKE